MQITIVRLIQIDTAKKKIQKVKIKEKIVYQKKKKMKT